VPVCISLTSMINRVCYSLLCSGLHVNASSLCSIVPGAYQYFRAHGAANGDGTWVRYRYGEACGGQ